MPFVVCVFKSPPLKHFLASIVVGIPRELGVGVLKAQVEHSRRLVTTGDHGRCITDQIRQESKGKGPDKHSWFLAND